MDAGTTPAAAADESGPPPPTAQATPPFVDHLLATTTMAAGPRPPLDTTTALMMPGLDSRGIWSSVTTPSPSRSSLPQAKSAAHACATTASSATACPSPSFSPHLLALSPNQQHFSSYPYPPGDEMVAPIDALTGRVGKEQEGEEQHAGVEDAALLSASLGAFGLSDAIRDTEAHLQQHRQWLLLLQQQQQQQQQEEHAPIAPAPHCALPHQTHFHHQPTTTAAFVPAAPSPTPIATAPSPPHDFACMVETSTRLLLPAWSVGRVIGKGGDVIKSIREMTGARITILPPGMDHRPVHSRMVCVVGPIPAAALAVQLIGSQAGLFDDDVQARAEIAIASESGQCNDPGVRMVIEGSLVGQLFGWRGKRVQQVRSVAGVRRIQVLSVEESRQEGALYGERVVLLLGKRDACRRAHQLLCCVLAADPVELERREEKEKMAAKAARVYAAQQRFLLQQQQQLVGQGVGVGGNDGNVLPLPFHQQRWDASATAAPAGPVPTTTTNNGGSSTAHQPFPMAPAFVLPTPAAHHAPSPAASSSTTHLIDPQQQHHLTVLARMEAVAVATAAGAPSPSPYTATAAATDDDAPSVAAGVLGHDRRGSTDRPLASSSPTPLQPTTTANNYTTSSSSFQKAQQGEGEEEAAALAAAAAALAVSGAGVLDAVGGCDSFPSAACQQQQLLELQQEGVPMLSFAPYASSSSSSSLNDEPMPMGEFSTEVVIHISNDNVGRLIGKEGSIVRRIRQESQCHIQIDNCPPTRVHTMRCVRIRGHIAQTHVAMALVLRQLMAGDMCTGGGDNVGGGTGRVGSTSAGLGTLGDGGPALM